MAQLLLRVAELTIAALLFFVSLRGMGMLRRPESAIGKGGDRGWSASFARLGAGVVLIALASDGPYRDYPFAGVLRRGER